MTRATDARGAAVVALAVLCAVVRQPDAAEWVGVYGSSVVEIDRSVQVRLHGKVAVLTLTTTVANRGDTDDVAELGLALPDGGVATGLRIAGPRGAWTAGRLLEANEAQAEFDRLTTDGERSLVDGPALLAWVAVGEVSLRVFPVRAGATRRVEVTVRAPTCYARGRRLVGVPRLWSGANRREIRVRDGRVLAATDLRSEAMRSALAACTSGEVDDAIWASFAGDPTGEVDVAYAAVDTPAGQSIAAFEVAARSELGETPRGATVVFVVDASHSVGATGIATQLELVKGYLAHLPDARFDIVLTRRDAERLFGHLVAAGEVDARLAALPSGALAPDNGSFLDRGLALASSITAGATGPVRIVAFTDTRLREQFDPAAAAALAPSRAIVHVVDIPAAIDSISLGRDDNHPLSRIAAAHGGMFVTSEAPRTQDHAGTRAAMRGLIRPLQIDDLAIETEHGEVTARVASSDTFVPVLAEGESVSDLFVTSAAAPRRITVTGKIWARSFRRTVAIDPVLARELPALVFGTDEHTKLDPASLPAVARAGGAVSPVTSYLAVPRRLQPGSLTIAGVFDVSTCHLTSIGTRSTCGIGTVGRAGERRVAVDLRALLRAQLAPRLAGCRAMSSVRRHATTVSFEVQATEIADVTVATDAGAAFAGCVADAAWEIQLDDRFSATDETLDVAL